MSSEETVVVETSEAEETHGAQGCNIPQWFSSLCHRAGMAETAPAAWCRIYTQPDVICLCCLVANCVAPTLNTSLLYFASGPLRWTLHPFAVVYSVSHYTVLALTWRMGPDGALRPLSKVCMLAAISIYIPLVLVLLLGPESQCPFRSRLIFTFINSFSMWTWTFAAVCGNWAMDHPEKPYRTLVEPLVDSVVRVLRMTDAITDMLLVRLMLDLAKGPCYWFGRPGQCRNWVVMATVAGTFAGFDLCFSVFLAVSGSGVGRTISALMQRVFMYVHIGSFICEVAVILVTLVKLSNDVLQPAVAGKAALSHGELRNSIVLTTASFVVTLMTFTFTMLGMKRAVGLVVRAAHAVSARCSSAYAKLTRTSAMAAATAAATGVTTTANSVVPLPPVVLPNRAADECEAEEPVCQTLPLRKGRARPCGGPGTPVEPPDAGAPRASAVGDC